MKIKEITAKKDKDLLSDLSRLQSELTKMRFGVASRETNKHTEVSRIKNDIAQVKTILREREIQRMEEKNEKNA